MIINRSTLDEILKKMGLVPSKAATPNTAASRDANANLTADMFLAGADETPTAATTTTLTVNSKQIQVFTGSTTQTVMLPTTEIPAGTVLVFVNKSSGAVAIYGSGGGSALVTIQGGTTVVIAANQATPTAKEHWSILAYPANVNPVINSLVLRDGANVVRYGSAGRGSTTTTTTSGTTALSYGSNEVQSFTGTNPHTVQLPTTGISAGFGYTILNLSTGVLTVNSSAGELIVALQPGSNLQVVANTTTPTTAAHWSIVGMYQ